MSVASLLTATLAAFQPPHVALRSQPQPILSRVSTAAAMSMPPMLEPPMHAQMAAVGAAATLLADGDGGMLGAVFDTLRNIFTGVLLVGLVAIPLYYIYGVFILSPEEREEQGIGKLLTDLTYAYTPSPWRKTYLAGTEEEEARDPLDLPSWCSEEATLVTEPECVVGVKAMQRMQLSLPSLSAPLDVCYWSAQPEPSAKVDGLPPVLLIHGFDSSVLEFRFVLPSLVEAGLEVRACTRDRATP